MAKLCLRVSLLSAAMFALNPSQAVAAVYPAAEATPPTSSADAAAGSQSGAGFALLGAALGVIVIGLAFAYWYHRRLLETVDRAIDKGQTITTDPQAAALAQGGSGKVGVSGPAKTVAGQKVTYEATGYDGDGADVSWVVEGAQATPSTGEGPSLEVTFQAQGSATITATQMGKDSEPTKVTVAAPPSELTGIVLPFAIQNWGRLIVVVFGIGVVSALMTWDVVSAEGGIGLLGALLGIGGAAAAKDEVAKPKTGT